MRTPMDPIRPSTPDAYMPMGVANGAHTRRRYDSVTYDSRGSVAPPSSRSSAGAPMYGMRPTENVPASAEDYRLRSMRASASSQSSRSNSMSSSRHPEDLRLPPLHLENAPAGGEYHRSRSSTTTSSSRPPVAGSRPSHLRTSSTANMPPPFTLEPQPMWSSPSPVVPIPVPGSKSSALDARSRSGSDPIRDFNDLNLNSQSRHHRNQSLQVNPAPAVPSPLARLQSSGGPPRSSTPGPYPAGYAADPRATVGVRSPPVADPVGRSSTPSPAKKSFWARLGGKS